MRTPSDCYSAVLIRLWFAFLSPQSRGNFVLAKYNCDEQGDRRYMGKLSETLVFYKDRESRSCTEDRFISYVATALAACMVYDNIITFDQEVELIWKRPKWSIVQILFLVNRYVSNSIIIYAAYQFTVNADATMENVRPCTFPYTVIAWGGVVTLWAMQGIMIFRISSIYHHSRKIIIFLLVVFVTEAIAMVLTQALSNPHHRTGSAEGLAAMKGKIPLCLPQSSPPGSGLFWIPIVIFECVILGLSIRKGIQYRLERVEDGHGGPLCLSRGKSVTFVLLRDCIIFPFLALVVCLFSFIGSRYFSFSVTQINILVAEVAAQVTGSRLLLNFREAYYCPFEDHIKQEQESDFPPMTFSTSPKESTNDSLEV